VAWKRSRSELAVPDLLIELAGRRIGTEGLVVAVLEAARPICAVDPDGVLPLGYDSADERLGRRSHETVHCRQPGGPP
jgi:hypothetical protein